MLNIVLHYTCMCMNSEWIILKEKQNLNVHLLNRISGVHVFVFKISMGGGGESWFNLPCPKSAREKNINMLKYIVLLYIH